MKIIPNITFLRYFFSAGKLQSISKAAKENFVTQSAISQAISKLEITVGKKLITHEKNRFQLTSDGKLLLEKCKEVFSVFAEIEDAFNEVEGIFKGTLSLACTHSFALSLLPSYLEKLFRSHKEVDPILRFGHTGMIVEWVKAGEIDFGIVLDNEDFSAFHAEEIYQGKYRLYKGKKTSKDALGRWIISEERKEISLLKRYLQKNKIKMESYIEVSSWEVIASLTEQGLGVGFLPDYIAKRRGLVICNYPGLSIPYRILAISSKQRKLSRNAEMFIQLILRK